MMKPRFTVRVFLLAAVLLGCVAIPWGYKLHREWRFSETIFLVYTDVKVVARVVEEVYELNERPNARRIELEVDDRTNSLRVQASKEKLKEIRELVTALDEQPRRVVAPIGGSRTPIKPDAEMIQRALNDLLRETEGK